MKSINNYSSKLTILLKSTGLWLDSNHKHLSTFFLPLFRITIITMNTLAIGLSVYLMGLKESLKGVSLFLSSVTVVNIQLLLQVMKHNELKDTLHLLHVSLNFYTEKWELNILSKAHKIAWKIIGVYKWMIFLTWLFYFTLPPVIDIIIYFTGYEIRAFNLPLPLSGYLDKNPPRNLKNTIILLFSIFWSTICFISHIGSMGTFFALIMYTHAMMKIFNSSVDHLMFSKEHINKSFDKIITMHQNIIKLGSCLQDVYGLGFLLQNVLISLCVCMSLLTASTTQDNAVFVAYTFGLFYYTSLSVVCCCLGQLIENESDKMMITISNVPWSEMTPKIRRNLVFILLQSSRMIEISFKGYSPLNFNTLMKIFNTAYSYFMLLQTII